jgi:hypothetical protein
MNVGEEVEHSRKGPEESSDGCSAKTAEAAARSGTVRRTPPASVAAGRLALPGMRVAAES